MAKQSLFIAFVDITDYHSITEHPLCNQLSDDILTLSKSALEVLLMIKIFDMEKTVGSMGVDILSVVQG